jgi:hypothetical protein
MHLLNNNYKHKQFYGRSYFSKEKEMDDFTRDGPLKSKLEHFEDRIYFNTNKLGKYIYLVIELIIRRRNYSTGEWITKPLGFLTINITKALGLNQIDGADFRYFDDTPRNLLLFNYMEDHCIPMPSNIGLTVYLQQIRVRDDDPSYWKVRIYIKSWVNLCIFSQSVI